MNIILIKPILTEKMAILARKREISMLFLLTQIIIKLRLKGL